MEHLEISRFLAILVVMLGGAKLCGSLARRVGQPAVLGELFCGTLLGTSLLGWVDPNLETIHLLSELGVIVLLFAIGLETDLKKLLQVGFTSFAVAVVGVTLPFLFGYVACKMMGKPEVTSIMAAATLTATSVGITARVLSEIGKLHAPEGQVILGAAVIDDILGLVILTIVMGLTDGEKVSLGSILTTTATAFGFLAATLLLGSFVVPRIFPHKSEHESPGESAILALILAFGLAWLAEKSGSAMIVGAFAAGLLVASSPQAHEIETGITALGRFFVPLFFVVVGASVDVSALDPTKPESRGALLIGLVLIITGVIGKGLAGYAPFWFRGNKTLIGVGMIPRGEVGLIFAQKGLEHGVFDMGMFGGVTLMVMITTLIAPPLLKVVADEKSSDHPTHDAEDNIGIDELVNDS
ncbi:MAG: potassium transporter Kef [Planctomycetes bacterium SCN 63-9]|nr:MAG: potassium transporter Kef [Planctomycetes bacterium SCN 63-9]